MKYPQRLAATQVDAIVDLAGRLGAYRPRRRWFRRLDPVRRLHLARGAGLLDGAQLDGLLPLAGRLRGALRFAHGDLTARNLLAGAGAGDNGDLVLIDWEWAGLYPPGYDLAFLWYSLADLPEARMRVERHALLVELWHLHWYLTAEHRPKHEATRDLLLGRLGIRASPPRKSGETGVAEGIDA